MSRPRHGRRRHRAAIWGAMFLIAAPGVVLLTLNHLPDTVERPSRQPVTQTSTDGPTAASPPMPSPAVTDLPLHDPGNTNPYWRPCKHRLGLDAVSDYKLTNEQEVQILACIFSNDINH